MGDLEAKWTSRQSLAERRHRVRKLATFKLNQDLFPRGIFRRPHPNSNLARPTDENVLVRHGAWFQGREIQEREVRRGVASQSPRVETPREVESHIQGVEK